MNRDWILVRGGTAEAIRAAVVGHSKVAAPVAPAEFRVQVYRLGGGDHAVRADPPLPPYTFANLINWLDDPAETGAASAVGWLTSPGSGTRYSLAPKVANAGGDTLVGLGDDGERVEVFLPDCSLTAAHNRFTPADEPAIDFSQLQPAEEFVVIADADRDFGNPDFVAS